MGATRAKQIAVRKKRIDEKNPAFAASSTYLASQLRRDVPGQWTDNRIEQSNHYRGVIYVAIRSLMDAILSSTVQINRKHRRVSQISLRRLEKADALESYFLKAMEDLSGRYAADLAKIGDFSAERFIEVSRSHTALKADVEFAFHKALPTPSAHSQDEQMRPFDDPDHSLVKLVTRPNRTDTFNELLAQLILQYHLTGSGLMWANPNNIGLPAELYILPTALCYAQPPDPNFPEGWWRVAQYYPAGGYGIIPSALAGGGASVDNRDIFQFKNPHPLWRWDAMSPLTAGGVQLDILESIDQARWTAMDLGLTPDMVLLAPGVQQAQLDAYLERLKHTNVGKRNHRKVMAIGGDQGDSKFDLKFPNTTAKDMDFASGWDQMTAFALALFGVPKSVASLATTGSYAELYAALKQFHTLTLRPLAARLGVWLTKNLAHIWSDELAIQIDLPTIDDQQLQETQFGTDLAHDLLTWNEARAIRGRKPMPGGDVLVSIFVQKQQAKAQQEQQAQNPQPAPAAPGQPPADPNDPNAAPQQPGAGAPQAPVQPQQPQPGGDQQQPDPSKSGDPLATLLGTATPGGDDGHVQNAVADAALGALGVPGQESEEPQQQKGYEPAHLKARNPNAPPSVKPKKIGSTTTAPPGKRAPQPATSDSLNKAEEANREPGEQYPSPAGKPRQQTQSDTSAPAPAPKPAPAPPPVEPAPATAKTVAPTSGYRMAPQPKETTDRQLNAADAAKAAQSYQKQKADLIHGEEAGEPAQKPLPAPTKPGTGQAPTQPGTRGMPVAKPVPQPLIPNTPVATQAPGGANPGPWQHRKEGERWQGPSGHNFELRNGRPVPIANPTSGVVNPDEYPVNVAQPDPATVANWFYALNPGQRRRVADHLDSVRRGQPTERPPTADPAENAILDTLARDAARTGTLPTWMQPHLTNEYEPVDRPAVPPSRADRARAARVVTAGLQPEQQAQLDTPSLIEKIAADKGAKKAGINSAVLANMSEESVWDLAGQMGIVPKGTKPPAQQTQQTEQTPTGQPQPVQPPLKLARAIPIAPPEQIKAAVESGQMPDAAQFAPAAQSVPVNGPAAQTALANVQQWAAIVAERHVDAVAQHFGISPAQAHALLVHAMTAIAQHAAQRAAGGGPATASATLSNAQTGQSINLKFSPRTVAARQVVNDMIDHLRGGHDLEPRQAGELVKATEHLPPEELKQVANTVSASMTVAEKRDTDRAMSYAKSLVASLAAAATAVGGTATAGEPGAVPKSTSPAAAMVAPAPAAPDMTNPLAPPVGAGPGGAPPAIQQQTQPAPAATAPVPTGPPSKPKYPPTPGLSPEDAELEQKSQEYADANYEKIKAAYLAENGTPDPDGGHTSVVLNTDEFRHHLPGYNGTNASGVHEAASSLAKKFYAELLQSQKGKGNNRLLVLAGGGGSGKGTLTNKFFHQEQHPIILDQVSGNLAKLEGKIDEAKKHGYEPTYAFVDRPVDEAFMNGVVRRAANLHNKGKIPRTVEIDRAMQDNTHARKVALALLEKRPDIQPHIMYMDEHGQARMITDRDKAIAFLKERIAKDAQIVKSGAREKMIADVYARYKAGEIPEHVAKGLIGRDELSRMAYNDSAGVTNDGRRVPEPGNVPADDAGGSERVPAEDAGRVPSRPANGTAGERSAADAAPKTAAGGTEEKGPALGVDEYVSQAMSNLKKTSRTAAGTVDTSASKEKADKIVEGLTGEQAAAHAANNFEQTIRQLHNRRNEQFTPESALELADSVNRQINKGITKEGVLLRTDDSPKFPYTKVEHMQVARRQFAEELAKRLNDPNADPVETAAWIEWRTNLDHVYADGVGKTMRALAALPLMKAGLPLPNYGPNKEYFRYSPPTPYNPHDGADAYRDADFHRFLNYYRKLMPKPGAGPAHDPKAIPGQPPPKDKPITMVYGGSFSPAHTGHVQALNDAKKHLEDQGYTVHKVVAAPSADKLLRKKLGDQLVPLEDRTAMLKKTLGDRADVDVTSEPGQEAEANTGKLKRTQLADWAARKYPGTTVVNVTGSDAVPPGAPANVATEHATFAGASGTSHEGYYYTSVPRTDDPNAISSSAIRKAIQSGQPLPQGWMTLEAEQHYRDHLKNRNAPAAAPAEQQQQQPVDNEQQARVREHLKNLTATRAQFENIGKNTAAIDKEIEDWTAALRKALAFALVLKDAHTPASVDRYIEPLSRMASPAAIKLVADLTGAATRTKAQAIDALRSALNGTRL